MANDTPPDSNAAMGGLAFRLYDLATGDDDARLCNDIPGSQCREQPQSFVQQVLAQALSKTGDVLADSKVVLPWLLGAVGAPVFLIGVLVPIRESLALMPQVLVGGLIRRFSVRKGFWVASSVVEGLCIIMMGVVAAVGLHGIAAGWAIIGLLIVFSLARGVASIAAKDTLGKTVSKGRRGRVSGYAATGSGLVASVVGLYLVLSPVDARPDWLLYAILIVAGLSWLVAAATFSKIKEYPGATVEVYVRPKRVVFAFPTNDGLFAVFVGWPIEQQRAVQTDISGQFAQAIALVPDLAERLSAGTRMERFRGAANLPNFLRRPYGPGWALVGDAGCHKDPYLALGMRDAFRDADLLADLLDEGLSGRRPLEQAMADYERRRNEATMADYRDNLEQARFKPPAAMQRKLLAALRESQENTNRFFMAREELIEPDSFLNPENLRRLVGECGATAP